MQISSASSSYRLNPNLADNSVVCLMAPTASGKTALAYELYDTGRYELISFNDANAVKQQLIDLATKMSIEDLWVVIADIEDLLAKYAFKSINNQRLIALMLSATAI